MISTAHRPEAAARVCSQARFRQVAEHHLGIGPLIRGVIGPSHHPHVVAAGPPAGGPPRPAGGPSRRRLGSRGAVPSSRGLLSLLTSRVFPLAAASPVVSGAS